MHLIQHPSPALDDGVVSLRGFDEDDIPAVVAACQDPEIPRWTVVPTPYTERDARAWIESHDLLRITGNAMPMAIIDSATRLLAGSCGLHELDWRSHKGEIGYWVVREMRGLGTATRAVRLLSRWALLELGLARLELFADVNNEASQRVALNAGFVREGVLRSARAIKGERHDMVLFSLVSADLGVVHVPRDDDD